MAGHSPSKTGVNALMPGHPRLTRSKESKAWMPGTSPGMTELLERPTAQPRRGATRGATGGAAPFVSNAKAGQLNGAAFGFGWAQRLDLTFHADKRPPGSLALRGLVTTGDPPGPVSALAA